MSREEQIEEIKRTLYKAKGVFVVKDAAQIVAETLYNAGYRKQNEVTMEIFEDIYKLTYRLSNDEHYTIGDMIWDIDELKKKYTDINQRKEDENDDR